MPQSSYQQSANLNEIQADDVLRIQQIWVSDVMSKSPLVIEANEKIEVALGLMADNKIRHLPVIDQDENLQGIISDRDLLKSFANLKPWVTQDRIEYGRSHHPVREFMTATPEVITPDSSLLEAGSLMLEYKISCLPVVEGNKVVGIITESDFVKIICGELSPISIS